MEEVPLSGPVAQSLRLLAFVVSVMVMFFLARQGQTQPVMYGAFALFLVTATLWTRGLDENWVARQRDHHNGWLLALALVLPALITAAMAIGQESARSTFVLGAAITAYLLAGLGVRWLRLHVLVGGIPGPSWLWRWQMLVGLLVVAYAGLWLLGRAPHWLSGLALLVAVVTVPAFVHVVSERRIHAMSTAASAGEHVWMYVGGAAAAVGIGIGAATLGHSVYVFAVVVVAALLTWALTVGSLADIAAVLAVLALMGVTPGSQDVKPAILTAKVTTAESVVVSLGDSYSSGEGAARYLDGTNVAGENQCRRAATAWPVLVAQSVGADRLVFRACSGARARHLVGRSGVDEQYAAEGIQLSRALADLGKDSAAPTLVLISVGGNDSGFRQVGSSCLSLDRCDAEEISDLFYDNLPSVEAALEATYAQVADSFPDSPIAVMPYPDAFASTTGCPRAPVEEGDISFVTSFTEQLDESIERAADKTGLYYVEPMRHALVDSQVALCDGSGTPGLNFLDFRGVGGRALERFNPGNWIHNSLHPNERGHAALAAAFSGWLSAQTRPGDPETTGLDALLTPVEKRAQDDLGDPDLDAAASTIASDALCFDKARTCAPKADRWALARVAPKSVPAVVLIAVVVAGTWALAIGFSVRRVRRRLG